MPRHAALLCAASRFRRSVTHFLRTSRVVQLRRSFMSKSVLLAVIFVSALSNLVFAQATGRITGRVTDQAGGALPGVTVVVTESGTGVVHDTVANAEGLYSVPALNPGTYTV